MKRSNLLLFSLAILFVFGGHSTAQAQQELSESQILKGEFDGIIQSIPRFAGWKDDTQFIMAESDGNRQYSYYLYNAENGERQTYKPEGASDQRAEISDGDVYFVDENNDKTRITETDDEENNPTLSPDGSKVAYTRAHDLYVTNIESGEEQRITNDGSDVIYNGWSSWVYMEEILGRSTRHKAFWWSPDSKKIAFMRFDDRPVRIFPIHSVEDSYGTLIEQRYPKAGFENPNVKIGIAEIGSTDITWADYDPEKDQYFGMPYWKPGSDALWTPWMNRDQDHLLIHEINLDDGSKSVIYEERQDTWIALDNSDRLRFLEDGDGFLLLSDKSGWNHIYHYSMDGNLVKQITSGNWSVGDIEQVNQQDNTLFFSARKENSARTDLYKIQLDGGNMQRITFGEYDHRASVSPGGAYIVTTYSNTSTPTKVRLMNSNGETVKELADSKGGEFDTYNLAKTELLRIETEDGFDLPVEVTWPANIDKDKTYPVLISIYGGPGSTGVMDRWNGLGLNQWWAKEGLIQISIDHRGSGHFGKEGMNYMHRNLGHWEIEDYSTVMNKLMETYDFIDGDRIGITGFSYGGYVTSLALTKGADLFDYGLAGGSVTDWHLYDTHYTERYMDHPDDNTEGYESSSVMNYVDNYKGHLMMVHGSMDDNVHIQNSLQLVSALESAGKDFTFIPYLGGKHGWYNLRGKYRHYQDQRYKFYYKYLLEKEAPQELLNN